MADQTAPVEVETSAPADTSADTPVVDDGFSDIPDTPTVDTSKETPKEASGDTPAEAEPEGQAEEQPSSEQPDTPDADKSVADPKEQARKGFAQRQQLKNAVADKINEQYRVQTPDELASEGFSPEEARIAALEQRQSLLEYTTQITELNASVDSEAAQVINDFSWANPDSPDYDEVDAKEAADLYRETAGIEYDETGQYITSARFMPHDFYKRLDGMRTRAAQKMAVEGKKAAEKQLDSLDVPSSSSKSVDKPKDAFEDGFDNPW